MSLCFNIYPDRYIFNIIEFRIFGVQGIEVNEGRGGGACQREERRERKE